MQKNKKCSQDFEPLSRLVQATFSPSFPASDFIVSTASLPVSCLHRRPRQLHHQHSGDLGVACSLVATRLRWRPEQSDGVVSRWQSLGGGKTLIVPNNSGQISEGSQASSVRHESQYRVQIELRKSFCLLACLLAVVRRDRR